MSEQTLRMPKFLSFSALCIYEQSPEDYAKRYLTEIRPPRDPQSKAAAAGSAFDAYVKSALHFVATGRRDPEYSEDALIESQVDEALWDWARPVGQYLMKCYTDSQMYGELCKLIWEADSEPRFEFDVYGQIEGVPIFGKPDCEFIRKGARILLDWKVMGFAAKKSGISPYQGYRLCRDGYNAPKPSQSHGNSHKKYKPRMLGDLEINTWALEDSCMKWADQLAMYGWVLGDGIVGDDTIYMIDQLVCKPMPKGYPLIRVANFRAQIRRSYQRHVADRLVKLWRVLESGHIFPELSREESDWRLDVLNKEAMCRRVKPNSLLSRLSRPDFRG